MIGICYEGTNKKESNLMLCWLQNSSRNQTNKLLHHLYCNKHSAVLSHCGSEGQRRWYDVLTDRIYVPATVSYISIIVDINDTSLIWRLRHR